jgi:metal-responsive CopG/Arc/MetJ family transcriptional regulator
MKTTISIPDTIFEVAEKLARRLGISRSQLFSDAVEAFVKKSRYSGITEQLDAVYKINPGASKLDKVIEEIQFRSLI